MMTMIAVGLTGLHFDKTHITTFPPSLLPHSSPTHLHAPCTCVGLETPGSVDMSSASRRFTFTSRWRVQPPSFIQEEMEDEGRERCLEKSFCKWTLFWPCFCPLVCMRNESLVYTVDAWLKFLW